jgi:hypothetical protein
MARGNNDYKYCYTSRGRSIRLAIAFGGSSEESLRHSVSNGGARCEMRETLNGASTGGSFGLRLLG